MGVLFHCGISSSGTTRFGWHPLRDSVTSPGIPSTPCIDIFLRRGDIDASHFVIHPFDHEPGILLLKGDEAEIPLPCYESFVNASHFMPSSLRPLDRHLVAQGRRGRNSTTLLRKFRERFALRAFIPPTLRQASCCSRETTQKFHYPVTKVS